MCIYLEPNEILIEILASLRPNRDGKGLDKATSVVFKRLHRIRLLQFEHGVVSEGTLSQCTGA